MHLKVHFGRKDNVFARGILLNGSGCSSFKAHSLKPLDVSPKLMQPRAMRLTLSPDFPRNVYCIFSRYLYTWRLFVPLRLRSRALVLRVTLVRRVVYESSRFRHYCPMRQIPIIRPAARILLVDEFDRVFLFKGQDPKNKSDVFWGPVGGGIGKLFSPSMESSSTLRRPGSFPG